MTYIHRDQFSAELVVVPSAETRRGAFVRTETDDGPWGGVYVDRKSAPAAALAILEASGIGQGDCEDATLANVLYLLKTHIESGADAKLDAEALELFNAGNDDKLTAWPEGSFTRPKYRAIAIKARSMHTGRIEQ